MRKRTEGEPTKSVNVEREENTEIRELMEEEEVIEAGKNANEQEMNCKLNRRKYMKPRMMGEV